MAPSVDSSSSAARTAPAEMRTVGCLVSPFTHLKDQRVQCEGDLPPPCLSRLWAVILCTDHVACGRLPVCFPCWVVMLLENGSQNSSSWDHTANRDLAPSSKQVLGAPGKEKVAACNQEKNLPLPELAVISQWGGGGDLQVLFGQVNSGSQTRRPASVLMP
ncbi:PREDICTED: uncharacterized protein LOC105599020 isoform X8 [Cercocebus atys]|uniref:uncharacterized protein LOC105599020 isoform X8 n=1 Tax=Cercocebus atys TaxID=9531 RepID=UPI0005F56469|nr:PREDICTED: uncharacterized protein LOC105599020 isoform X8 [Cercocebus atys]